MQQRDLLARLNRLMARQISAMVQRRLAAGSIKDEAQRAAASRLLTILATSDREDVMTNLSRPTHPARGDGA